LPPSGPEIPDDIDISVPEAPQVPEEPSFDYEDD
jgi:hypothetical protein